MNTSVYDLLFQAVAFHRNGQFEKAENAYRCLIETGNPPPEALHNLGTLYAFEGDVTAALGLIKKAAHLNPDNDQFKLSLAEAMYLNGDSKGALEVLDMLEYRYKALQLHGVNMNIGQLDLLRVSTTHLREAIDQQNPPASHLAPTTLMISQSAFTRLREWGDRLVKYFPEGYKSWIVLATAHYHLQEYHQALNFAKRASKLAPRDSEVLNTLGVMLKSCGMLRESLEVLTDLTRSNRHDPRGWSNLGAALIASGRFNEAVEVLNEAVNLNPGSMEASNNFSVALRHTGQWHRAQQVLEELISKFPDYSDAKNNLAVVLRECGDYAGAKRVYESLLASKKGNWAIYSNWLFASHFDLEETTESLARKAKQFGANLSASIAADSLASDRSLCHQDTLPQLLIKRRGVLRIGLVSGDFRTHPVGYFLKPLLQYSFANQAEFYIYSNNGFSDETTAHLKGYVSVWQQIDGLNDIEALLQIRKDHIDILVDLSGHTALNRLPLFARRAAPIQLTWLGYFATTGLTEIDGVISDKLTSPDSSTEYFAEELIRLPATRLCFAAPEPNLPVQDAPLRRNGFLTFGSFQHLTKINNEVLILWAEILRQEPSAKLRIQSRQFIDSEVKSQFAMRCLTQGVSPAQLELTMPQSREQYLESYKDIDVVLDTFPFPGGTTTFESLWMGVPTITLLGDRMISRQGASILSAAGLDDWIATDRSEYLRIALECLQGKRQINALRSTLRSKLTATPLMNGQLFSSQWFGAVRCFYQRRFATLSYD